MGSLATYAGLAIGYLNIIILYPAFLSPEQMGLTRLLIAVGIILSQFSLLGTPYALIRYFPYFRNAEAAHHGLLRYMLMLTLLGFGLVGVMVLIARPWIEQYYADGAPLFNQYFYWIFPMAFFMALGELFFNHFRSLLRTAAALFIREILLRLLQTAALGLWMNRWVDFSGFVAAFAASYIITALLLATLLIRLNEFFYLSRVPLGPQVSQLQIFRFSLLMFASGAAATIVAFIDTVMLGALRNLHDTAVYSVAFALGTLIHVPARTMNMVAVALVAEAWRRNDLRVIGKLYHQTALNQFIVGSGLFLLIWLSVDVLLWFLPEAYAAGRWVIFIVAVGRLLDMSSGSNGEILAASKHARFNLFTNLLLIAVAIGSNYLLIPRWGIHGAAWATVVSMVTYNAVRMAFLFANYKLHPFSWHLAAAWLVLLLNLALAFLLPDWENVFVTAAYKIFVVGTCFCIMVLKFRLSPEINQMVHDTIQRFSHRQSP